MPVSLNGSAQGVQGVKVELNSRQQKQLEQMLRSLTGNWRGQGTDVDCETKTSQQTRSLKLSAKGRSDDEAAFLKVTKKHKQGTSPAQLRLFLKDKLLRVGRESNTDVDLQFWIQRD